MDMEKSEYQSQIYRGNWKMFMLRFSTFFLELILVSICFIVYMATKFLASLDIAIFRILPFIGAGFFILACAITLFQFILSWVRFLGTYLRITPDSIAYNNLPYYGIVCDWDSIISLEVRMKFGFRFDVLVPTSFEYIGKGTLLGIKLRNEFGIKEEAFIPLSGFSGWPDGKLANDIKQFARNVIT